MSRIQAFFFRCGKPDELTEEVIVQARPVNGGGYCSSEGLSVVIRNSLLTQRVNRISDSFSLWKARRINRGGYASPFLKRRGDTWAEWRRLRRWAA
ncbi:hypothetical protein KP509_09G081200 [Ceratopteris richardii]|uniref:Uncharacterized protein n=1 Tax=Ceratopteris richardii TaxID=49495 RepID=A0A8T2U1U8_CERRI|nr:hypothetical protein KP509_09G081200 [Ceratopteris richardii]